MTDPLAQEAHHVSNPSLLIVDDDVGFVRAAAEIAQTAGFDITLAGSLSQARNRIRTATFDLAMVDLSLPDGSGLDLFPLFDLATTQIVLITGQPTVESAIRAFKTPVLDYLIKPLDARHYRDLLATAAARKALPAPVPGLRAFGLVGESPAMRDIVEQIRRVAHSEACVLIHGESGVGKSAIAEALHEASGRHGQFCTMHCASVPAEQLASQIFGIGKQSGHVEKAHTGTLFLEDITQMPLPLQGQLLRVLEHRRMRRVDSLDDIDIEVRLVAGINGSPQRAVEEGRLREDLYYRLGEIPIHVPPLRERPEDIRPLADLALARLNERYRSSKAFTAAAMERMQRYSWPGNARELRNAVSRAYLLARDHLLVDVLQPTPVTDPLHETPGSMTVSVGMTMEEIERRMLFKTLQFFDNDKVKAAEALGISVKTIYNRLARYQAGDAGDEPAGSTDEDTRAPA